MKSLHAYLVNSPFDTALFGMLNLDKIPAGGFLRAFVVEFSFDRDLLNCDGNALSNSIDYTLFMNFLNSALGVLYGSTLT